MQFRVKNSLVTIQVVGGVGLGLVTKKEQTIIPNKAFQLPGKKEFAMNFFNKYVILAALIKRVEFSVCIPE